MDIFAQVDNQASEGNIIDPLYSDSLDVEKLHLTRINQSYIFISLQANVTHQNTPMNCISFSTQKIVSTTIFGLELIIIDKSGQMINQNISEVKSV